MTEHISYAMRNEEARQSLIYFNAPVQLLDWSFLAIQAIIFTGLALAIIHAIKTDRKNAGISARLTLLNCFLYGLCIDILSYYTVENFWHGEFSVMFLFNKLPLYIACFYPAFMYHICMVIRRYQFKPLTEATSAGFLAGFMYLIFDNLGPLMGWWIWDTADPTTLPYVNSVPLTSYHWFFTFTAAFVLVNRKISWDWPASGAGMTRLMPAVLLQPVVTILLGSLFFIPYNLFAKNMPPYTLLPWAQNLEMAALVHVVSFSAAGWIFWSNWKRPPGERDELLMVFPFIYLLGHAYIYIAKYDLFFNVDSNGLATNGLAVGNLPAVFIALLGCSAILLASQPRKG